MANHLHSHQAVIRLSKQYLPNMAAGFNHPKVKVHIGDGFKFLDDYKNTFDVIITDSSDPEGPAESLFQKPYFQLLHDALREGGVITTQGCMSHLLKKVETWEECPLSPGQALNLPDPALCHLSGGYRVVVRLGFPHLRRISSCHLPFSFSASFFSIVLPELFRTFPFLCS